ncbi:unnamed protein product [Closterium sp. NIES-53]
MTPSSYKPQEPRYSDVEQCHTVPNHEASQNYPPQGPTLREMLHYTNLRRYGVWSCWYGGSGASGTGAGGAGVGGTGAGGAGVGGPGVGGAGAQGAGAVALGGAVRPRPYFVPLFQQVLSTPSPTGLPPLLCPPPDLSRPPL